MMRGIIAASLLWLGSGTALALDPACAKTTNLQFYQCPQNSTDWFESYYEMWHWLDALSTGTPKAFTANMGILASSGSFTNNVTASSGTFTATGNGQFSVNTSSGIKVTSPGQVYADWFVGSLQGNATTASGAPPTGSASGDLNGSYPSPTVKQASNAGGFTTTVPMVAQTSVTVNGILQATSGYFTQNVTASSGSFTATGSGQASVVTSSGIIINGGMVQNNGDGGLNVKYGVVASTMYARTSLAVATSAPAGNAVDVTGWINTDQGVRINNGAGDTATCTASQYLGGATWKGGIPRGGTCSTAGSGNGDMLLAGTNNVTGSINMQSGATLSAVSGTTCTGVWCVVASSSVVVSTSVTLNFATSGSSGSYHMTCNLYNVSSGRQRILFNNDSGSNYNWFGYENRTNGTNDGLNGGANPDSKCEMQFTSANAANTNVQIEYDFSVAWLNQKEVYGSGMYAYQRSDSSTVWIQDVFTCHYKGSNGVQQIVVLNSVGNVVGRCDVFKKF